MRSYEEGQTVTADRPDFRKFIANSDLLELERSPHLWNINSVSIGNTATTISGWCLPFSGRPDQTRLVINGKRFSPRFLEKPSGIYAELYPWHPNAAYAGFSLDLPHGVLDVRRQKELTFEVAQGDDPPEGYKLCLLVDDLTFAIPDAEIAARIGVGEPLNYTMFGRSIYRGFEEELQKATGRGFAGAGRIVDWGCGSARVSRHIVPTLHPGQTLTGFDIDAPAVDWSNRHVGPHFRTCGLNPPLDLSPGTVDVVFAYSVFTHLSEAAFHVWLAEMRRILAPGGVVMFTILGDFAMAALSPDFPRSAHQAWVKRGIYDDSGNAQLDSIGVEGDIYRNTWVKQAFVRAALDRAGLKLLSRQSPFHFYQDLIVARRD